MDVTPDFPQPLRYDGTERRLARGEYLGEDRRRSDPVTEQDHPELYEPQEVEQQ